MKILFGEYVVPPSQFVIPPAPACRGTGALA
jgi:hypothetical protein